MYLTGIISTKFIATATFEYYSAVRISTILEYDIQADLGLEV